MIERMIERACVNRRKRENASRLVDIKPSLYIYLHTSKQRIAGGAGHKCVLVLLTFGFLRLWKLRVWKEKALQSVNPDSLRINLEKVVSITRLSNLLNRKRGQCHESFKNDIWCPVAVEGKC
jgi:hypothetical protein